MWIKLTATAALIVTLALAAHWGIAQPVGPANQILCTQISSKTLAAGTTSLVSGVSNKRIHVCGWTISSNSTNPTIMFSTGTGPTCTSPPITVNYVLGVKGEINVNHLQYAFFSTPLGQDVCATIGGSGTPEVFISFYYVQF